MALDRNAIRQALRQWLMVATSLPDNKVIDAFDTGPQPEWPYIELNANLATMSVGMFDEKDMQDGVETRILRQHLTVSVNVYAAQGQAEPIADLAWDALESEAATTIFDAASMSLLDKGHPRNLSELEQTQYVERFEFDAQFAVVGQATPETVGTIASVGVSGSFASPAGTTSTSATIS